MEILISEYNIITRLLRSVNDLEEGEKLTAVTKHEQQAIQKGSQLSSIESLVRVKGVPVWKGHARWKHCDAKIPGRMAP